MIVKTVGGFSHHISRGDIGPRFFWPGAGLAAGRSEHAPLSLTAVACGIRIVAESLGSMVMRVWQGDGPSRQLLLDHPNAAVLQDGSVNYATSMDTWSDVATEVELEGFGLLRKARGTITGKVKELYAFPVRSAIIYVDDKGNRVVEARINGELYDVTDDVIVVRGWSPIAAVAGVSTLALHRRTLRGQEMRVEFVGRYFENDSMPSYVISKPDKWDATGRKEFRETWDGRHKGPNGDPMGLLWGGMTVQQLTKDLQESQVAALQELDDMQVAQMLRIFPQSLLVPGNMRVLPPAEIISDLLWRLTLMHRCRRIERAVSADRELFPKLKVNTPYARLDASDFLRGDIATMTLMAHQLVQSGIQTKNEARAQFGMPRSTDPSADKLQETPVGGAPNADPPPDPNPDGEPDE